MDNKQIPPDDISEQLREARRESIKRKRLVEYHRLRKSICDSIRRVAIGIITPKLLVDRHNPFAVKLQRINKQKAVKKKKYRSTKRLFRYDANICYTPRKPNEPTIEF